MKKTTQSILLGSAVLLAATPLQAADYLIDTQGGHAAIEFKIQHLGISWLKGRFNTFSGDFSYDPAAPQETTLQVDIDVSSIDSNHAERDKHLRSADYLNTGKYPDARFVSTGYQDNGAGKGTLTGDLTLHGVTQPVTLQVEHVGEGKDPWGGYRIGFAGTTAFQPKDFGMDFNLGPDAETVYMELYIEGIRQ